MRLTVRDTGIGIPPDELPHVFERFHRVEGARARTHEGTGIGLALVQELVKLHGGTGAGPKRRPGQGTFTVTLPLGTAHLPSDRIARDAPLRSPDGPASHYVEEALRWLPDDGGRGRARPGGSRGTQERERRTADSARGRQRRHARLRAATAGERYDVEAVADGRGAGGAAAHGAPDLVLTDVMMPGLDGFGLLRGAPTRACLRTAGHHAVGSRREESRVEGMEAGADDYLVKPFSGRELLARVSTHVELARIRREAKETLRERRNFRSRPPPFWKV